MRPGNAVFGQTLAIAVVTNHRGTRANAVGTLVGFASFEYNPGIVQTDFDDGVSAAFAAAFHTVAAFLDIGHTGARNTLVRSAGFDGFPLLVHALFNDCFTV